MVCKKNTNDLYWFGPRDALRPVGEMSYVLSCTEVLVVGVTSGRERERERERERGAPKSQGVSGECASDSAGALARSRRVICSCVFLMSSPLKSARTPLPGAPTVNEISSIVH
jgi:hypothetical protein